MRRPGSGAGAAPVARLLRPQVRLLFWKEVRQLTRSRGALVTGVMLPAVLMVLAPVSQLLAARSGSRAGGGAGIPAFVPGLQGINDAQDLFLYFSFPLFFVLAGLLTPSLMAIYTIVSERERHSLDLLMALPVEVRDILTAKLGANLVAATVTLLPLFCIDAAFILAVTSAGPLYILAALLLVVSALIASIGVSLLAALLARDFRTSNNLSGAFVLPAMLLTGACVALVPGLGRFAVLSALLLLLGAAAFLAARRWLTFERYLS